MFKAILDADGEGKGNPEFEEIDIVDDFPSIYGDQDLFCDSGEVAWTGSKQDDRGQQRVQIILCPPFFKQGTFQGGPDREWPRIPTPKCSNVGSRVSTKMDTLGSFLLHEYTHVDELVQPPLCEHVEDHEYGYYDTRELALTEPDLTKHNADSYAAFATELTWSKLCHRDFEAPLEDHGAKLPAPDDKGADTKGADTKETHKNAIDSKATSSKRQESRYDIQLAPSLHRRTPLPNDYGVYTPTTLRTNKETGESENTYTTQQMDQFQQGHMEVLTMCRTVIEASTREVDRFNRIFGEYFPPADRQLVLGFSPLLRYMILVQITDSLQTFSNQYSAPKAKAIRNSQTSTW